ncbi:hypothetical protein CAPTEDRAFT_139412 [Capitella teleta]|uniref:Post-GPI attachment to proteins factor 3 n=1 Tax=Capitella teleta TaxID=283909 RepID=R7TKP1_CAPTE|nr:hypothetical protein CAPTEDRAFT_139412 [Capitella teleta]|eukprot:ELT94072.1 hypothetical protein CAPTEDRAFT_139412 [Capitella teleta]
MTWTEASVGDRSEMYLDCLRRCFKQTTSAKGTTDFRSRQTTCERIMMWGPRESCRYDCMWKSVESFQQRGLPIPQYHGKWPFVKICGIQEPASTLFSIANGASNALGLLHFHLKTPWSFPLTAAWTALGVVAMNAWFWSTLFHARDTDFTEKMDYFCAFSLVMFMFFSLFLRFVLLNIFKTRTLFCIGFLCAAVFCRHVYHMAFVHFDYGYNMKVNILFGVLNSVSWLAWCVVQRQSHTWKAAVVVLASNALILLEVLDFPPLFWTLDAHALWHAGTSPLPLLWFR